MPIARILVLFVICFSLPLAVKAELSKSDTELSYCTGVADAYLAFKSTFHSERINNGDSEIFKAMEQARNVLRNKLRGKNFNPEDALEVEKEIVRGPQEPLQNMFGYYSDATDSVIVYFSDSHLFACQDIWDIEFVHVEKTDIY